MSGTLTKLRGASVSDLIGLSLVGLVLVWLVVNFLDDPTSFIDIGLIGLTNGTIYGIVALGYTLVYGKLQLINFAHGDVFALSGLVASTVIVSVLGLDKGSSVLFIIFGLAFTLLVIMSGFALFNSSIERVAYKPLRNAPPLAPLITAIGMSFIVQNIGLAFYGVNYQTVPNFIPRSDIISIGNISYSWSKASVLIIVVPLLIAPLLVRSLDEAGQGDAGRGAGHGSLGDHGNRRQPDDLGDVSARRSARGSGGSDVPAAVQDAVRHGFRAPPDAFTAAVLGGIGNLTGAVPER